MWRLKIIARDCRCHWCSHPRCLTYPHPFNDETMYLLKRYKREFLITENNGGVWYVTVLQITPSRLRFTFLSLGRPTCWDRKTVLIFVSSSRKHLPRSEMSVLTPWRAVTTSLRIFQQSSLLNEFNYVFNLSKFSKMELNGSDFTPYAIPASFDLHNSSPTSSSISRPFSSDSIRDDLPIAA